MRKVGNSTKIENTKDMGKMTLVYLEWFKKVKLPKKYVVAENLRKHEFAFDDVIKQITQESLGEEKREETILTRTASAWR